MIGTAFTHLRMPDRGISATPHVRHVARLTTDGNGDAYTYLRLNGGFARATSPTTATATPPDSSLPCMSLAGARAAGAERVRTPE